MLPGYEGAYRFLVMLISVQTSDTRLKLSWICVAA